jgi:hypothetical protein
MNNATLIKYASIILLIAFYQTINSQTTIATGTVSGTWTTSGSPYLVTGSIQIANGQTLIIEPGVTVMFQGAYKLLVSGRILAQGNNLDSIHFKAQNTSIGWRGLRFDSTPITNDSSKVSYCSFENGIASGSGNDAYGGSIYFRNFSKARIVNCTFRSNSAPSIFGGYGGAIYCYQSSPIIEHSNFFGNNAYYGGGAFYSFFGSPVVNNCIFIGNQVNFNTTASTYGGGAVHIYYGSSTLTNNLIANNHSNNSGGGLLVRNSNGLITNCTIVNNNSSGTGNNGGGGIIFLENSNPTIFNTIIQGNSSSNNGDQVYLDDENSDPNFYYSLIQGGSSAFGLNGTIYSGFYVNCLNVNPQFNSPNSNVGISSNMYAANWRLLSNSPCIDAGNLNGGNLDLPNFDLDLMPRVQNGLIDIGAYEFPAQCNTPQINVQPAENIAACQNTSNTSISVVPQTGSNTFQWYAASSFSAGGVLITGAVSSVYTPPTSQVGTVYYYCIVSSGTNCNTTSQRSAFTVTNAQSFTATMEDRVMCSGYTASIAPNLSAYGGTYLWSNATGVINLPSYYNGILSVSPLVTTTYYLNYTIGNCVNYFDSSVVTIRPPVTVNVNNASICAGSPTTLTAAPSFGGGTYLWSNGATTPSITVSPSSTTNYSVSYTVNQCISTSSDCLDPALGNYSSRFHYLAEVFFLPPGCGCDGITYGTGYNGAPPADMAVSINGECGEFAPSLATDAATVIVSSTPTATTATATLCPGSANSFTVIGTPNAAVSWTTSVGGSGTFIIPAGGTAVVAPSVFSLGTSWPSGTTITLTQIALNGCVAALNSTITVTSALTASVSTTSPVCAGSTSTITFTGTPSAVVTYNIGGGNLIVALNASGTATVNTPALTSNTTVTVTQVAIAGGCSQGLNNSAAIVVNSTGYLPPSHPLVLIAIMM